MYDRKAPLSAPWMTRWSYVDVIVMTCEMPVLLIMSGGKA